MQWTDEGIVLSVKPLGETSAVVELFTRGHGRHLGLVHGGRSRRLRPLLQVGNHVDATWKARLSEQLGHITLELRRGFAAESMESDAALSALMTLTSLLRMLPERDSHPNLYEITLFVLGFLDDVTVWPALMVRWEMALLTDLGFGLDLSHCAATGTNDNLVWVSPKSGRAVSASAGEPYRDRLLPLPGFLIGRQGGITGPDDIDNGFRLTGHFLESRVFHPREMTLPEVRGRMVSGIATKR